MSRKIWEIWFFLFLVVFWMFSFNFLLMVVFFFVFNFLMVLAIVVLFCICWFLMIILAWWLKVMIERWLFFFRRLINFKAVFLIVFKGWLFIELLWFNIKYKFKGNWWLWLFVLVVMVICNCCWLVGALVFKFWLFKSKERLICMGSNLNFFF